MKMTKGFITLCVVLVAAVILTSCGGGGGGAGGAAYIPSEANVTSNEQETTYEGNSVSHSPMPNVSNTSNQTSTGPKYMTIDFACNVYLEHSQYHEINHFYFEPVYVDGQELYGQVLMSFRDAPAPDVRLGGTFEIRHFPNGHVFDITTMTNEGYGTKFSINTDLDYKPLTVTDYMQKNGYFTE